MVLCPREPPWEVQLVPRRKPGFRLRLRLPAICSLDCCMGVGGLEDNASGLEGINANRGSAGRAAWYGRWPAEAGLAWALQWSRGIRYELYEP